MHYQRLKIHGSVEPPVLRIKSLPTKKWCPECEDFCPKDSFYKSSCNYDGLAVYCIPHQREKANAKRRERRAEIISHLGGKCIRCGFNDSRALQVDHVNGGGRQEYVHGGYNTNSVKYLKKIMASPDEYQLLCANCNWIKREEEHEVDSSRWALR
jgi:hypothetical protein